MLNSLRSESLPVWYFRYLAKHASQNPFLNRFYSISPTVDMYFRTPLAAYISGWKGKRAIQALGPHVFIAGDQAVILRYASDRELAGLKNHKPKQTAYVIDDLLAGLNGNEGLPEDYTKRLDVFTRDRLPRILEAASDIVAPNDNILAQFPDLPHSVLGPCAMAICGNFSHVTDLSQPFKLVLSGTRSHRTDSMMIVPALARLLKSEPGIHLTTFLGNHVPDELKRLANCEHRVAMPWPLYKRYLTRQRFHAALYPTCDTAFNRARSWSKILDHAAFGAASLFSPHVAFRDYLSDGQNAVFCSGPESWIETILELKRDRDRLLTLARAGAELATVLGSPQRGRDFWSDRLNLQNGLKA